jgi:class 3 adenylate cyclase/tetratricopeptide (TPR) repeat protein
MDGTTRCLACSAAVPRDVVCCPDCGRLVGWDCPRCANPNKTGDHFCWHCGTVRSVEPFDYLPMERKLVTVLFTDIRGSFALIHGKDPERIDEILNGALALMRRSLHAFGGTVCRVVGDGILALFGAPVAAEDHAIRACHAALAVIQAFREAREATGSDIEIRVGLSSGEVLVKTAASDTATNYDAKGEDVFLAARMEQLAEPGTILVSDHTRRLAEGFFAFTSRGATEVKGLPEQVETFVLRGAIANRSRLGAATERGLSAMVDRLDEQEIIARIRHEARSGATRTLLVRAEAGQGKSRLIHETIVAATDGGTTCVAQVLPYGRASFRTVRDLLAPLFGITAGDDADTLRQRITNGVGTIRAGELTPPLAALYGQPTDDPEWRGSDDQERLHRIQDAVCTIFGEVSRRAPLALVVEDAHWIDPESSDLLGTLMQRRPNDRLLLAVTSRPEFDPPWAAAPHCTEIALPPLAEPEMRQLFASLLPPGETTGAALENLAIERAAGNPFFLEETLAALADDGTLAREGDHYRLVGTVASGGIPSSVRSLLSARIDRLSRLEKDVLQVASIAGMAGSIALLGRLTDLPDVALREVLERLRARGFLRLAADPEPDWKFRHALTHDTAYAGMPRTRRVTVHRAVVEAFEALWPGRRRQNLELLAWHAEQGELWAAAAGYAHEAGKEAAWWRRANDEALGMFRHALTCVERMPDGEEKHRLALDLQLALREPLMWLGRIPELSATLAAAEPLARALSDWPRLGLCLVLRCHALGLVGDPDAGLRSADEAIALAAELGDRELGARARYQSGMVWFNLGDYKKAIASLAEALTGSANDPTGQGYQLGPQISVTALSYMARALGETGNFPEALRAVERARRLASSLADPFAELLAMVALGHVRLRQRQPDKAQEPLLLAMGLSGHGNKLLWPVIASLLGTAQIRTGEIEAGLALLEQSVAESYRIGMLAQQPARLAALTEGYLAAGRRRDALVTARRVCVEGTRQRESGALTEALLLIGQIIAPKRPAAAHRFLSVAREQSLRLSMLPTARECEAALAALRLARTDA